MLVWVPAPVLSHTPLHERLYLGFGVRFTVLVYYYLANTPYRPGKLCDVHEPKRNNNNPSRMHHWPCICLDISPHGLFINTVVGLLLNRLENLKHKF